MRDTITNTRKWITALLLASVPFGACEETEEPKETADSGFRGSLLAGEPCTDSSQCESGACLRVSDSRSVCTGTCDSSDQCPQAPNWMCTPVAKFNASICVCRSDANSEKCDDGLDNDCDGIVDCPTTNDASQVDPDTAPDAATEQPDASLPQDDSAIPTIDGSTPDTDACPGAEGCEEPPDDLCAIDPALCPTCDDDSDCDDAIGCTRDACRARGCVHVPADAECEEGEICDLRNGCVAAQACARNSDCADNDACTRYEYCDPGAKVCRFLILDGDGDERFPVVCGGNDCDDDDPTVYEGALDVCDGRDNDCDGTTDPPSAALACGPGRVCWEGACLCDADHVPCRGHCLKQEDVLEDDYNCGECGNVCSSGRHCDNGECVDIDECDEVPDICGDNSICTNLNGSYACECEEGYDSVYGSDCEDINECEAGSDNCDGSPDACVNEDGDFSCECPDGYDGDGVGDDGCADIDECELGTLNCTAALRCVNIVGSADCSRPVLQVVAGGTHSCALLDIGTVKCWGYNSFGQLGLGDMNDRGDSGGEMGDDLPTVDLGSGRTAKAITAGASHTCAILDNDTVKCWGSNGYGRLGLGDTVRRGDHENEMGDNLPIVNLGTERTAKAISAGEGHTCAILDDDTVKCWGYNNYGQLGLGNTANRGDGANEMGDNLPIVNVGTGRTAKAISAGNHHTCALLDNDALKCWGSNGYGRLGLGDTYARGDSASEMGDNLPAVDLGDGRTAKSVSAGGLFTCARLDNDSVKCWGSGGSQLGLEDSTSRGDHENEMGDYLAAVDLGTNRTAKAISAGPNGFVCAILDNDSVKCWGNNDDGQLGLGDDSGRGDYADSMGDSLPIAELGESSAISVTTGLYHTCALLDNDTIKCWGRNSDGQLGVGDTINRGDDPDEMGALLPGVLLGP